jgi:hypothetical protein
MGTIIEFPPNAASRRPCSVTAASSDRTAEILILPVVRIERHADTSDGGPEQGDAPRRRRRRRARS